MKRTHWLLLGALSWSGIANAQEIVDPFPYSGPASIGSSEPLFRYDDQERWKHGYMKDMPYYGGYHFFRPYNYHQVFSLTATAAGWGMPASMPNSQQFWHKYEDMTDLSRGDHSPLVPYEAPVQEWDHYPTPIRSGSWMTPAPANQLPRLETPGEQVQATADVVPARGTHSKAAAPSQGPSLPPAPAW